MHKLQVMHAAVGIKIQDIMLRLQVNDSRVKSEYYPSTCYSRYMDTQIGLYNYCTFIFNLCFLQLFSSNKIQYVYSFERTLG